MEPALPFQVPLHLHSEQAAFCVANGERLQRPEICSRCGAGTTEEATNRSMHSSLLLLFFLCCLLFSLGILCLLPLPRVAVSLTHLTASSFALPRLRSFDTVSLQVQLDGVLCNLDFMLLRPIVLNVEGLLQVLVSRGMPPYRSHVRPLPPNAHRRDIHEIPEGRCLCRGRRGRLQWRGLPRKCTIHHQRWGEWNIFAGA
mmetsp:Transcript_100402/g.269652  ORF Transcript_100402/g.269652 Transcript_100402/m.269652 type:complete len:200 (+) Transcript_100402:848-1447(+)